MPNKKNVLLIVAALFLVSSLEALSAQDEKATFHTDFYGSMGGEVRYFTEKSLYPGQRSSYFSSVFKPELLLESQDRTHQILFRGFARIDQFDQARTHWDVRDLYWRYDKGQWELNMGIKTLTWGKTESNNLVDIINQDDLLEGRSLEYKLGQPLIQMVYSSSWGIFEFFTMSYLRELRFPGYHGRLRPGFKIQYGSTLFEEQDGSFLPDWAIRFSRYYRNIDFAVSHFYGTDRLPHFILNSRNEMIPVYEEIQQTGLEFQWLKGPFALKMEGIHQSNSRQEIQAITLGGEYSFYFSGNPELKFMAEYTYDERGKAQISGMNNDLFIGTHLNLNDIQSSQFLLAGIYDLDYGTILLQIHTEKRIGNSWKLIIDYNGIRNTDPQDFYHLIRNDSFLEVSFLHYF